VDAGTGLPLPGVEVSLWPSCARDTTPARSVASGADGEFEVRLVHPGQYRLVTWKAGYGHVVREVGLDAGSSAEAVLTVAAAEGLLLKVMDARDGRALEPCVVVRDSTGRLVAQRGAGSQPGGVRVPLTAGSYLVSAGSIGYSTLTVPVTAPGPELELALTPGGTVVVEYERGLPGRILLRQPDGAEYMRCWRNGIADVRVRGRRTTVPNVAPGAYTVEIVDDVDGVRGGAQVEIREGQVSIVVIE
jgi:hypothetical protein